MKLSSLSCGVLPITSAGKFFPLGCQLRSNDLLGEDSRDGEDGASETNHLVRYISGSSRFFTLFLNHALGANICL